jgi:hypothetical protein
MIRTFGSPSIRRIGFALISLLIIALGAFAVLQGKIEYQNWRGLYVFAPLAIIIGLLGLIIVGFKPQFFQGTTKKSGRIRGWPTGRARYYCKRR